MSDQPSTPPRVRLGTAFIPSLPPEELLAMARACEGHLDGLWVWEDCFKESGIAAAVAALGATESLTVGLGLMPAPLRNVALAAMEIATVHRLFPGRFVPGIGHGVQSWMSQAGARAASPMTLLTEYADSMRRLLDGERVTTQGRYVQLEQVQLDWPPAPGSPLMMGGTGPRTLELCGRMGSGVLLATGMSHDQLRASRDAALAGWRSSPRAEQPMPLVHVMFVATGSRAQERLERELAYWDTEPAPGRCAAGGPDEIAAAIRRCGEIGATEVVALPTRDEPDVAEWIAFLGTQVRSALG
ncbi:MAG: LLM class flavin-dependent oxidoreductase [Actinomycetales bacterium]